MTISVPVFGIREMIYAIIIRCAIFHLSCMVKTRLVSLAESVKLQAHLVSLLEKCKIN